MTGSPTGWYVDTDGSATFGASAEGGSVSISTAGVVSYTPPTGFRGPDSFFVRARNAGGNSGSLLVNVAVANPVFAASVTDAAPKVERSYSQTVTISGGQSPYSGFSATGLPPGLTISSTGVISGTPTTVGSYNATITVTDSSTEGGGVCFSACINAGSGYTGTANLTLTVGLPAVPTFSSTILTLRHDDHLQHRVGPPPPASTSPRSARSRGSPTAWYLGVTGTTTTGTSAQGGTVVRHHRRRRLLHARGRLLRRGQLPRPRQQAGGESEIVRVFVSVGNPTFSASVSTPTATLATPIPRPSPSPAARRPTPSFPRLACRRAS